MLGARKSCCGTGRHVGSGQVGMTGAGEGEDAEESVAVRDRGSGSGNREEDADAAAPVSADERLSRTCTEQTVCPQCRVVGLTRRLGCGQTGQRRRGA